MEIKDIMVQKALGTFRPNLYLSNMAVMFFEEPTYAHHRVFPICTVDLPSGFYYSFDKADLARNNVYDKPPFGSVAPAVFGISSDSYSCKVKQILIGMDEIMTLPFQRTNATVDPRRIRVRTITEQLATRQEIDFAEKYFKASAWANVWTGAAAYNATNKQFKKFDNSDVDPVILFDELSTDIRRKGRRKANKLVLGLEVFNALKNNTFILNRIKYSGTTQNPAIVNENVLAQVFGVDEVVVLDATYNEAGYGATEDMKFICDSKGALLLYAPATPSIDEPSAGYVFTWSLENGNYIAVDTHEGAPATHTQLMEGIVAYDMKKTSDDLAVFLSGCVG